MVFLAAYRNACSAISLSYGCKSDALDLFMRSVNYIRPPEIGFSCCMVSKILIVAFAFLSIS